MFLIHSLAPQSLLESFVYGIEFPNTKHLFESCKYKFGWETNLCRP